MFLFWCFLIVVIMNINKDKPQIYTLRDKNLLPSDYVTCKEIFSRVDDQFTIKHPISFREGQNHLPGYYMHRLFDGHLANYLTRNFAMPLVFVESYIHIDFLQFATPQLVGNCVHLRYEKESFTFNDDKQRVWCSWSAKMQNENGDVIARIPKEHPLLMTGPISWYYTD